MFRLFDLSAAEHARRRKIAVLALLSFAALC